MTKSLLPQSPSTPQQLAGKDGFLAESHTWPSINKFKFIDWLLTLCGRLQRRARLSGQTTHIRVCTVQTTVESRVRGLPSFHGTKVRPSGRFPPERDRPLGSLVTGMPAETNVRAIRSFRARCLAVLPGAFLQTKLWTPVELTNDPHWQCTDVAHTGSDPAANQHPLSPPHRQAAGHTK